MRKETRKQLTDRRAIKLIRLKNIDPHGDYHCWHYWKVTGNWKYYRKTRWKNNKNMESDFICSVCNELTVDRYVDWNPSGDGHVMVHTYFCDNCRREIDIPTRDDNYKAGDIVDMQ